MSALSGTKWVGEMPDVEYHCDPCEEPSLSASMAHVICAESLAHARLRHPKFGGVPLAATRAMDEGDMLHALLLTGKHSERAAMITEANPKTNEPYEDFKTKRARELRDAAIEDGKTPVLPKMARVVQSMYGHMHEAMCRKGLGLVDTGKAEQVIVWQQKASSGRLVQCRTKIDCIDLIGVDGSDGPSSCRIRELKTVKAGGAKPSKVDSAISNDGYAIQAVAQISAVEHLFPELTGRVDFRWVFAEKEPPWCVTEAIPTGAALELGGILWQHAVDSFATALDTDVWQDYTGEEPHLASPTPYAMEQALSLSGEGTS